MIRCIVHALLIVLFVVPAGLSADVMLDDFIAGVHNMTTSPFGGSATDQYDTQAAMPGAVGPLRLMDHTSVVDPLGEGSMTTEITGGDLNVSVTTPNGTSAAFVHGIFQNTIGIPGSGPGNVANNEIQPLTPAIDLSSELEFELEYTYTGPAFSSVIQFYVFGDTIATDNYDQSTIFILESGTNTISLDLSTFFSQVDPTEVGAVGFSFVSFATCDVQFHRFEAVGGTTGAPPTTADSFTVERGTLQSGTVADTHESDDSRIVIQRETGLSRNQPVSVVFDGQLPGDMPSGLEVVIESRGSTQRINQRVLMFNWTTGRFDPMNVSQTATGDTVFTVAAAGNHLDYVQPGTGNVRTRVGYELAPRAVARTWSAEIDQLIWREP